jgi:protein SCO1/2
MAQDGQPFHSQVLAGKIWVADFIYTTCPGPCPRMTSQMREVQDAVSKIPDVRLVSFTVDPAEDTPPVLAAYAKTHGASESMWYFLTGPVATLQMLDRDAFKLGNIDASMQHSTRFVLVDRQGRIRRYYDTSESTSIPKLISDIYALAAEHT